MISLIISVYQSYEAVRRQRLYFRNLNLPIDVIIVDDGSTPPISSANYFTNNKLAWTQGLGRNLGASHAHGEYLLFTDIDHVISVEAVTDALTFTGSFMRFPRRFGILNENGELKTDMKSLLEYGMNPRYKEPRTNTHRNTFLIKKEIFNAIGGYKDKWCSWGYHPATKRGDDCYFDGEWRKYAKSHGLIQEFGSPIYVFPNGRFHKDGSLNPHGLFHDLNHKQEKFNK